MLNCKYKACVRWCRSLYIHTVSYIKRAYFDLNKWTRWGRGWRDRHIIFSNLQRCNKTGLFNKNQQRNHQLIYPHVQDHTTLNTTPRTRPSTRLPSPASTMGLPEYANNRLHQLNISISLYPRESARIWNVTLKMLRLDLCRNVLVILRWVVLHMVYFWCLIRHRWKRCQSMLRQLWHESLRKEKKTQCTGINRGPKSHWKRGFFCEEIDCNQWCITEWFTCMHSWVHISVCPWPDMPASVHVRAGEIRCRVTASIDISVFLK